MLSGPRALVSASEASDYMLHEYLVRNDEAHRTANRWHGRGAAALGLPERVSRRRFVDVLEGHVPGTDIRLGRVVVVGRSELEAMRYPSFKCIPLPDDRRAARTTGGRA